MADGRRVHHVAVAVRDLDAALGFYRDQLGLPLETRAILPDQAVEVALLHLANCRIELLQPLTAASSVALFLDQKGEGLHHVCFTTADIGLEMSELRGRGVDLADDVPREGLTGRVCFIRPAAHGNVLVELIETPTTADPEWWHATLPRLTALQVFTFDLRAVIETWRDSLGFEAAITASWVGGVTLGDIRLRFAETTKGARTSEGLFSIDLSVPDLDWLIDRLRAGGAGVTDSVPDAGHAYALVFDGASHKFPITLIESGRA